ncbi:MAG: alpha/beta hydrolase [Lachnospiraceae bacterium]|nr:alpha/beta hydrolase [Lachnospiraceae bacterium]MDY5742901.1 alpha/beta hydrolase [Lachnospiraceae bacterium]
MNEAFTKWESHYPSSDGRTEIYYTAWIPNGGVRGIIQIVHGMQEHIKRYEEFAVLMAGQGFVVVGNDHLGHGRSMNQSDDRGYFAEKKSADILIRDMAYLMYLTKNDWPHRPYILLGHSMGSFLVRRMMVEYPNAADMVIVMGTGWQKPLLLKSGKLLTGLLVKIKGGHYRSRLVNNLGVGAYGKQIPAARTDCDWLTRDAAVVDAYLKDPLCHYIFTVGGYRALSDIIGWVQDKTHRNQGRPDLPVLLISGAADPVGGNGQGVRQTADHLRRTGFINVQTKLYEQARHEILNELNRREVYEDIAGWIEEQLLAADH